MDRTARAGSRSASRRARGHLRHRAHARGGDRNRRERPADDLVPGRNLVFLAFAGALAYRRGVKHLVAGMCETDFSGYPDCRDDTVKCMQLALNLGMERRFVIHTPLMWIDKAATFALAHEIGGDPLLDVLVEDTHTCYLGDRSQRHDWGYGCGTCPACRLRADGFATWMSTR